MHFLELCKANNFYRAFNSKALAMELESLNFVQVLCRQVAFSTMGAANHRDTLNYQQVFTIAICSGNLADACPFSSTNVTNHMKHSCGPSYTRVCESSPACVSRYDQTELPLSFKGLKKVSGPVQDDFCLCPNCKSHPLFAPRGWESPNAEKSLSYQENFFMTRLYRNTERLNLSIFLVLFDTKSASRVVEAKEMFYEGDWSVLVKDY